MLTTAPVQRQAARVGKPGRHAIVIGSGLGGLAAAIRLGARGYRVTVVERLDGPGGRAYVFQQDGFTFDAGPTIITAPFLLEELWSLAGRTLSQDIDLRPLDPFYRIRFHDGETLDCYADEEEMRAEVARLSPGDVDGFDAFMEKSAEIYRVGFEELGAVPFANFSDMVKVLPDFVRLASYKSVYAFASRYVRDPRLRFALSFHPLFVGGNPFKVTSIYGLIACLERRHGVHFAMGGTGRIVEGMVGLIKRQGNEIRYNAEVAEVLVENGAATGVRLASGERIKSDIVVSNADTAWTYRNLVPSHARKRWSDKKIDRASYSMGLFVWYFGTARRYPDVKHHTILLGPRYKELLGDIFDRHTLADDFSLYLHRPTATDPSLAPEGCDAFYVLSPVPHLDAGIDWSAQTNAYREAIAKVLDAVALPGFQEHIVTSRIMTPQDFHDRLLSHKGAAFSFEPLFTQSAWFRPHNKSEDVEGLYLVGAGTHPGAGVPGVLCSAKILDQVVPHAALL